MSVVSLSDVEYETENLNNNPRFPAHNINNSGKGYKFVFKSDKEKKALLENETSENNDNKHHDNKHHGYKMRQLGHAVGKPFKFVFKKAKSSRCHGLDEYLFEGIDRSHLRTRKAPFHNKVSPQMSTVNNAPRQPGNYDAVINSRLATSGVLM